MFKFGIIGVALLGVAACAQSSIQPMAKDTFKVDTRAEDMCGPSDARNVAFKSAAIEVIRRGADKFIIVNDTTDESFWTGAHNQAMIVKAIPEGSPDAANALSAREQLGPKWQTIVAKGSPLTCG